MKVSQIVFLVIVVIGIAGFLLLGGSEGQIAAITAGIVGAIAGILFLWKIIKGFIAKK